MLHLRLELLTRHLQHYIIQPPSTTLTITLTRHAPIATLLEYIASKRSAALKRKMFGVSDGGELGHLTLPSSVHKCHTSHPVNTWSE